MTAEVLERIDAAATASAISSALKRICMDSKIEDIVARVRNHRLDPSQLLSLTLSEIEALAIAADANNDLRRAVEEALDMIEQEGVVWDTGRALLAGAIIKDLSTENKEGGK